MYNDVHFIDILLQSSLRHFNKRILSFKLRRIQMKEETENIISSISHTSKGVPEISTI